MPIYAYRCASCGHAKDVLQKLSDPLLTTCPACGAEAFSKQLTAAGFQLKGSGWYVTDFKGGPSAASPDATKPDAPNPAEAGAKAAAEAAPAAAAPAKADAAAGTAPTSPAGGPAPAAQ
jgi:putative FmdB family regulatory protein